MKTEAGSAILADANGQAGDIEITAKKPAGSTVEIDGRISSAGATAAGLGGSIFLVSKCSLTIGDTGEVTSKGKDLGAGLVHLEACVVEIDGLVASTGSGHDTSVHNRVDDGFRPGKPANSAAGVEVWGGSGVTVNGTSPHSGEIDADTGSSGGTQGIGWIDIFARGDISILNDAEGDHAVHAGQAQDGGHGGLITVKSLTGKVRTAGKAIQAGDTAAGGHGGTVTIEAGGLDPGGDVSFETASVQAMGSTEGGDSKGGGAIAVRSFNGCIQGSGELNADGGPPAGSVAFTACCSPVKYGGMSVPPAAVGLSCGGAPSVPTYLSLPPADCLATCEISPPPPPCPACSVETVVVDEDVTVDFNTDPPTYTGDQDLHPFFKYDRSGFAPDSWRAIFDVGARKLLVKSGTVITVVQVPPGSSDEGAPGIEITSTCEVEIDGEIVVQSLNEKAGPIAIHADGKVIVEGLVSDSGGGTLGIPGAITISTCCGAIETGPQSTIETMGTDIGGSDIRLVSCCGDISLSGLVDVFYKGGPPGHVDIAAFQGAVTIDGRTLQGVEAGTGRLVTSGVTIRQGMGQAPEAGTIKIQASKDITVLGNAALSTNPGKLNHGALAVKPHSTNGRGGSGAIIAVSLSGKIIAKDRAFDFDVRFAQLNKITLAAKLDIELGVTAAKNAGSDDPSKVVVSAQGGSAGRGGTIDIRSFSGAVNEGSGACIIATGAAGSGAIKLTSCASDSLAACASPGPITVKECEPPAPAALFAGCADFEVPDSTDACK